MLDAFRLKSALDITRAQLLEQRNARGHWVGNLASSALSTATAVSALTLARQSAPQTTRPSVQSATDDDGPLVQRAIDWLARHQNPDGGWGDTDLSYSNIATTMLALAAFDLAGESHRHRPLVNRAERYVQAQGGVAGLRRRYGKDRTFAVPILTNCALAGRVDWREVPSLPFELACVPQRLYRFLQLPVVSYAIPALVAIGLARYRFQKPSNPLLRAVRALATGPSLRVLEQLQPASGGFLEATPLTSFVVMSLASIGLTDHPVIHKGVDFLRRSVREDGSWPIDTNLATWNTTLALNALANAGEEPQHHGDLHWLLECQYEHVHPYTGAAPGGWGWSDLSGATPDADDTAGALLTLSHWRHSGDLTAQQHERILRSASAGVEWLLSLQNRDGGWPTFCRGWGRLPFDRSGADLTAHALRALHAWRRTLTRAKARIQAATARGMGYLECAQRPAGCWTPLWFGNQDHPAEENPVYGTSRVLLAYGDLGRLDAPAARRGLTWLMRAQLPDGGWGGVADRPVDRAPRSSVEETALAVEALLLAGSERELQTASFQGLEWLIRRVESGEPLECSPIGFYFAKLWYYEKLYPLVFTVSALGRAERVFAPHDHPQPSAAPLADA